MMKKCYFLLALVYFIPGSFIYSQCTFPAPGKDSATIARQLAAAQPKVKTACLPQAVAFAKQLIPICDALHYKEGLVNCYELLGSASGIQSLPDSAGAWFSKAIALAQGDQLYREKCFLAWTYRNKGDYKNASALLYPVLEYASNHNNVDLLCFAQIQLGHVAISLHNLPRADTFFNNTLEKATAANNKDQMANALRDLGEIALRNKQYDKARDLMLPSAALFKELGDDYDLAYVYNSLARSAVGRQNYAEAEMYYNKSGEIKKNLNDLHGLAVLYNNMGDFYAEQFKDAKAITAFQQSLALAKQIDAADIQQVALGNLAILFSDGGKYKEALEYQQASTALHDSLWNLAKTKEILALDEKYKVAQKEKAILQLHAAAQISEANARSKTRQRNLWIAGFIFICILILIGCYAFVQKVKLNRIITAKNDELQQLNKTKDYLFHVIGHDIRMPLSGLGRIADLIDYCLKNNQLVHLLQVGDDMKVTVLHIDHLLSNLLTWGLSQTGQLAFYPEKVPIARVMDQVAIDFNTELLKKQVTISRTGDNEILALADINSLKVILRNLLANAIKFTPSDSIITVGIVAENGRCLVKVKDAGSGISAVQVNSLFATKRNVHYQGPQAGMGVGLFISQEMAMLNGGTIFVSNPGEPGAEFICSLPLA